jgi:hypothetical protein
MPTRRQFLGSLGAVGLGLSLAGASPEARALPASGVAADPGWVERWPALALTIRTPPPETPPEVDLRADFGAAGDGERDDGPALRALAAAVNEGRVPSGAVVRIPAGRYRVVGDDTVLFRRPVVLRGDGPAASVLRLEYAAQRGVFLRAQGRGMYVRHSTGVYSGGPDPNRYPDAAVVVEEPDRFSPGDHVYLLCDDYGALVEYAPANVRAEHFLLKQHLRVRAVDGEVVTLDAPLRHDFAGAAPRLYRWQPVVGFGIEHLGIVDRSTIDDSEAANTFRAVQLDGVVGGWVWDVHFIDNTSIPLQVGRSREAVVSECLFERARHVGGGGNGYLPELYFSDDCLVEYCTSVEGRHALICNWSCWGNVFRYNRVAGTQNTETHGEYSVENLYLRNDARGSRMEIGGGGTRVHGHDGPGNELRENYARQLLVYKPRDRANRLIGNWHVEPVADGGTGTVREGNVAVPSGWDAYPFARACGHDHAATLEAARPLAPGEAVGRAADRAPDAPDDQGGPADAGMHAPAHRDADGGRLAFPSPIRRGREAPSP